MLSADVLAILYEMCDLEVCIPLSETSRLYYSLFQGLEKTVVRDKVLARVPWLELADLEADDWIQCARVIVNRTTKSLNPDHKNLYLLKDLKVALTLGTNEIEVIEPRSLQTNQELRTSLKPIFENDFRNAIDDPSAIRGSKLVVPGAALDLKTMLTEPADMPDYDEPYDYSSFSNQTVSPSGVKIRHSDENYQIRVISENDNLIHVRMRDQMRNCDTLVYKHAGRDEVILVNDEIPEYHQPHDEEDTDYGISGSVVSLLPGSAGALVVESFVNQPYRQFIMYIEPNVQMSRVLVCSLPHTHTYVMRYSEYDTKFYVLHNGYLHVYCDGWLVRLWVDFGYRTGLSPNSKIDFDLHADITSRTRCLAAWDRNHPLIGALESIDQAPGGHELQRCGKYVTAAEACGEAFGDLETGKTYFSAHGANQFITIPLLIEGEVAFGALGPHVSGSLLDELLVILEDSRVGADMNTIFTELCTESEANEIPPGDRSDISMLKDVKKPFDNENRDLEEEYPWSEDEESLKRRNKPIRKSKPDTEPRAPLYDDQADYVLRPQFHSFLYGDYPPVALNPSTMNSTKAFRQDDNPPRRVFRY